LEFFVFQAEDGIRDRSVTGVQTCALPIYVEWDEGGLTVAGGRELVPLRADLSAAGELTPTLAALCTLAEGESVLTGISHLRGHRSEERRVGKAPGVQTSTSAQ